MFLLLPPLVILLLLPLSSSFHLSSSSPSSSSAASSSSDATTAAMATTSQTSAPRRPTRRPTTASSRTPTASPELRAELLELGAALLVPVVREPPQELPAQGKGRRRRLAFNARWSQRAGPSPIGIARLPAGRPASVWCAGGGAIVAVPSALVDCHVSTTDFVGCRRGRWPIGRSCATCALHPRG